MNATLPEHHRYAVMVDCAVFGLNEAELKVLLIQRDLEPERGLWALPGGYVHADESLDEAAKRELCEETGVQDVYLEQFHTYGSLDRFPIERVVSVSYYALVKLSDHRVQAATDARSAGWFSIVDVPALAFDHNQILNDALNQLRYKVRHQPIGFELLPPKFPLRMLHHLYEEILDRPLDKCNFRKKILSMGILEELEEIEADVSHRAARLYRFDKKKYDRLQKNGVHFEL